MPIYGYVTVGALYDTALGQIAHPVIELRQSGPIGYAALEDQPLERRATPEPAAVQIRDTDWQSRLPQRRTAVELLRTYPRYCVVQYDALKCRAILKGLRIELGNR